MTAHAAFLQAITESPDDDTPRLIYADWLEEHGDGPRAEFIRLQVRLATTEDRALRLREAELLHDHKERWLEDLPHLDGVTWYEFRRGFVEVVRVATVEAFRTNAPELFRAAPVQQVDFRKVAPGSVRDLADEPFMIRLRQLMMQHQQLLNVGVLALAGSRFLSDLVEMWLPGNRIGDEGAVGLAESEYLTRLTHLDLRDNLLTEAGAAALAGSPNLKRLQTLYLVNNQIRDAGTVALAESPSLTNLRRLYLSHNHIADDGAAAVALSRSLQNLETLDLASNEIGRLGGFALATSPFLGRIQDLWLTGNPIDPPAAEALRKRFGRRVKV